MRATRGFMLVLLMSGVFSVTALGVVPLWPTPASFECRNLPQVEPREPDLKAAPPGDRPIRIVTGLQATFSLARAVTEGTRIRVTYLFPEHVRMEGQYRYVAENTATIEQTANQSIAAVTIRNAWSEDPLYPVLRAHNVRIIEIDSCSPVEPGRRSVSLIDDRTKRTPAENAHSRSLPYVWLSLGNATRMAEILSEDLTRITPDEATRVTENLARLKRELFALRTRYQNMFAEFETLAAVALCQDFRYLTGEFQIDVIEFEPKPEIHWSAEECQGLARILRENRIGVVIHKWKPAQSILKAIDAAGVRLVVLHTMNPPSIDGPSLAGTDYVRVMDGNLRLLHEAFANPYQD